MGRLYDIVIVLEQPLLQVVVLNDKQHWVRRSPGGCGCLNTGFPAFNRSYC